MGGGYVCPCVLCMGKYSMCAYLHVCMCVHTVCLYVCVSMCVYVCVYMSVHIGVVLCKICVICTYLISTLGLCMSPSIQPKPLFAKIEPERAEALRVQYAGGQSQQQQVAAMASACVRGPSGVMCTVLVLVHMLGLPPCTV